MSTPEPLPGSTEPPFISAAAERMWSRFPRIYRILDAHANWQFKRYLAGVTSFAGELDTLLERVRGSRPVGPATPEPWDLDTEDLDRWRDARRDVNSALTDPDLAEPEWLPFVAQLLGVYLHPQAGLTERRDTIRTAATGYRGGTKAALADAARSVLTGSRYVLVASFTRTDGGVATVWDITLYTRASETPDPGAVTTTVERKGAKPAGVRLWHTTYGTPWDLVEARFPTWTDWELRTWDSLEESGATYEVPENIVTNPSFEANITGWSGASEGGGSSPTLAHAVSAGVDGANALRATKVGATGGMAVQTAFFIDVRVLPAREYIIAASLKPSAAIACTLHLDWQDSGGVTISATTTAVGTLTAGVWNRSTVIGRQTSPAGAARVRVKLRFTGTIAAGVTVDVDAVLLRLVTAGGG